MPWWLKKKNLSLFSTLAVTVAVLVSLLVSHSEGISLEWSSDLNPSPATTSVLGVTQETNSASVRLGATSSATVTKIVDGDTIKLSTGKTVRLIGIDTPETKDPRRPVECFGQEAAQRTTELLSGKTVTLEKDVSETDRYGRLLRYVYVDEILINEQLVAEGYATATKFPPDVKYADKLEQAESAAHQAKTGLWSDTCSTVQ